MQPNAFILPGGSESEPARATGEEGPLPLNSAGVQKGVGGGRWRRLMGPTITAGPEGSCRT